MTNELRKRDHEVVAVDLPCEDDSAGLSEYADAVVDAIGERRRLVVEGKAEVHDDAGSRLGLLSGARLVAGVGGRL